MTNNSLKKWPYDFFFIEAQQEAFDFSTLPLIIEKNRLLGRWLEQNEYPTNEEDWSEEEKFKFDLTWK